MNTYCGANCENCPSRENCKGCLATCGSPFGGRCVAAECIKAGGMDAYREFKRQLTDEVNALLAANGIGATADLVELVGAYANLEYPMPSGKSVKLLNDKSIYLGAQIECADPGLCCGVIADSGFILLCSYNRDGTEAELIVYQKRQLPEEHKEEPRLSYDHGAAVD